MGRRILAIGAVVVVVLVSVALVGLLVFTNTDYGRERVRTFAQSAIQGAAKHGVVRLGRVSGNLLEGFTIANLSIKDSTGAPFLVADTVSLNYGLLALLLKRLELSDVRLVRPLVVMDRPPGDSAMWNYKAIFKSDTPSVQRDTTKMQFGDWIVLRNVTMLDGHIVIRSPWKPKGEFTGAQRDSAVARRSRARNAWSFSVATRLSEGHRVPLDKRRDTVPPAQASGHEGPPARDRESRPSSRCRSIHRPRSSTTSSARWSSPATRSGSRTRTSGCRDRRRPGTARYNFDNNDSISCCADSRSRSPTSGSSCRRCRRAAKARWTSCFAGAATRPRTSPRKPTSASTRLGRAATSRSPWSGTACGSTTRTFASLQWTRISSSRSSPVQDSAPWDVERAAKLDGPPGLMRVDGDVAFDDARYGRSRVIAKGAVGTTGHGVRFRDLDVTLDPGAGRHGADVHGDAADRRLRSRIGAPQRRDGPATVGAHRSHA